MRFETFATGLILINGSLAAAITRMLSLNSSALSDSSLVTRDTSLRMCINSGYTGDCVYGTYAPGECRELLSGCYSDVARD